jgi:hypothetical protein
MDQRRTPSASTTRAWPHDRGADDYITTEWSEAKVEQRYDWLFTYDAKTWSSEQKNRAGAENDAMRCHALHRGRQVI